MEQFEQDLPGYAEAQEWVMASMLIDERCVPLVISKLRPEDFSNPTCRNVLTAVRKLVAEGRPVDPVTIQSVLGDKNYIGELKRWMLEFPTAANVEEYIGTVRESSMVCASRTLMARGAIQNDLDELREIHRKLGVVLSGGDRMPRMSASERFADFYERMKNPEKPKYLPWGIPTADRNVYAELGDLILLGGYASSGKTLLSLIMAMAQAKAGYKVGYYSLETSSKKITDRQAAALSHIPLGRIKELNLKADDWPKVAEACNVGASVCPFPVIQAAGFTVEDITFDALGHGYQIIYVDYVQLLRASGVRDSDGYARVTAVSQVLKTFAQNNNIAVVALAQLTRPSGTDSSSKQAKPNMPTMHSFKESGQLEQDADVAFLVYLSDPAKYDSSRFFRIAKNKEGRRPDPVALAFQGDIQTMVELEPGPDYSAAAQLSAKGRAVQQANRAMARQVEFRELTGGDGDNPFA